MARKSGPTQHSVRVNASIRRPDLEGQLGQVEFELIDEVSRCYLGILTMSYDTFLNALSSLGEQPATVVLYHGPIGYVAEHKQEQVTFTERSLNRYADSTTGQQANSSSIERALAPYERGGWRCIRGSGADYHNHHRRVQGSTFCVSFTRYVHPVTGEVWKETK